MSATLPDGRPLVGDHVRLDLLTDHDLPALGVLLTDPRAYTAGYVMHRHPRSPEDGATVAGERFLDGQQTMDGRGTGRLAYAVRLTADGAVVGTTSLLEAHLTNERVHVGSTFYGPDWWGTSVNPEAKLLLLRHCFADCGFGRVKIQTDLLNTRSQAAITKLGAQREGVLRRHMRREDGTFRDTVVYSVVREEWPTVEAALRKRLA